MNLVEAKKILKDAGFLVENIDDVSSREELIELILEDPFRDENITLEILKTWSFEELEKYHEECEERYMDDVYGVDRDGIDEAKELLENNGYIVERYDLDYDSVNSSFDEEKRLEKFGEYLYEVRELLVRKGFSRGKQADNYDELHDIAHRCCRLGKSIDDCAKEIILTIK